MFIQQNSSGDIAIKTKQNKIKQTAEILLFLEFTFKGKDTNNIKEKNTGYGVH